MWQAAKVHGYNHTYFGVHKLRVHMKASRIKAVMCASNSLGAMMIPFILYNQWTNLNWNNSFVKPRQLPLSCEISGAIHIVRA